MFVARSDHQRRAARNFGGRSFLLRYFFLVDCEVDGRRAIGRCGRRGDRKRSVAHERDVQRSALRRHRVSYHPGSVRLLNACPPATRIR